MKFSKPHIKCCSHSLTKFRIWPTCLSCSSVTKSLYCVKEIRVKFPLQCTKSSIASKDGFCGIGLHLASGIHFLFLNCMGGPEAAYSCCGVIENQIQAKDHTSH